MWSTIPASRYIQSMKYLHLQKHQFTTIPFKEQILTRHTKYRLRNRRRLDFNDLHQSNKQLSVISNPTDIIRRNEPIDHLNAYGLPFEVQETINKYKLDNNEMQVAELETNSNSKEPKEEKMHSNKLLIERVSIKKSTGYLLKQPRILNQIFAEFVDKCTPFKIDVSKQQHCVTILSSTKVNINKIRQYIIKHIQNKTISIKCGDKKSAVIGCGGLNLKMIKNECNIPYIWEDDTIPGLIHIYDRDMTNGYKACNRIQSLLDRTSILSLPTGQYGLLIIDNAYWLDFIREHCNAFIVGLDLKPSELHKRKIKQMENINRNGVGEDIINNTMTMKSRLLISGDTDDITMNATQMLYEFLKDTEQIEIKKNEFAHILGKNKRTMYALVNEVESKFIDNEKYKQYFESEQIEENEYDDPFWLEGLRLSFFPIDEQLWIHGPPFMRNALKYYVNSVILGRRKFLFTHATCFWVKCLFEYKQECTLIHSMLRKLFGVKIKIVKTQKHIKTDNILNKYQRLYDYETYLLLESVSRDDKLNVNGIRKYFDELVESSIKIGLGRCNYLFERNDSMNFWVSLADKCNVSVIFDSANKQMLIIGLNVNVTEYQSKLLHLVREIQQTQQRNTTTVADRNTLEALTSK